MWLQIEIRRIDLMLRGDQKPERNKAPDRSGKKLNPSMKIEIPLNMPFTPVRRRRRTVHATVDQAAAKEFERGNDEI